MVQVSAIPPARAVPPKLLLLLLRTTSARKPGSGLALFPSGFAPRCRPRSFRRHLCRRTNTPFGLDAVLAYLRDARDVIPSFLYALTMERMMLVPDNWLPLNPRVAFPSLVDFSYDLS
jgi:hypothetical protein